MLALIAATGAAFALTQRREDRAQPDLPDARRSRLLARLPLRHTRGEDRLRAAPPPAARGVDGARRQPRRDARPRPHVCGRPGAARFHRHRRGRHHTRRRRLHARRPPRPGRTGRSGCRTRSGSTPSRRRSSSRGRGRRTSRPTATAVTTSSGTRYRLSEPAHAIVLVNGRRALFTRRSAGGALVWSGRRGGRAPRPASTCSRARRRTSAGNRSEPYPFAVVQVRYVALGRKRIVARPGGRFAVRVSTDAPTVGWRLGGRTGVAPARHARAAGAAQAGDSTASTSGPTATPPAPRGRRVTEIVRIAGALAAVGLAATAVAPGRLSRFAGLTAWAAGCAVVAAWLRRTRRAAVYALALVAGLAGAAVLAWLFVRVPWSLPVAILACAPMRFPVSIGETDANLLVPLYAVAAAAALALAWQLARGDRRVREFGVVAWPFALLVSWTGLSLLWSEDVRAGAVLLLFFVLPFGLPRGLRRATPVERGVGVDAVRAARGDGGSVRGRRRVAVPDPRRVLEPEGDRRERLRAECVVLPRQLRLLRPVDLREVPRPRDRRGSRGRARRARRARRRGGARRARDVDRAPSVVLAVELRRARRRRRNGARHVLVAPRRRARRRRRGARARRRNHRRERPRERRRSCPRRPVEARRERARRRGRAPGRRRGRRSVSATPTPSAWG